MSCDLLYVTYIVQYFKYTLYVLSFDQRDLVRCFAQYISNNFPRPVCIDRHNIISQGLFGSSPRFHIELKRPYMNMVLHRGTAALGTVGFRSFKPRNSFNPARNSRPETFNGVPPSPARYVLA